MNRDNMLRLIEALEANSPPEPMTAFDMTVFNCGTVGCMAGWAAALAHGKDIVTGDDTYKKARYWLELDDATAEKLFVPWFCPDQAGWLGHDMRPASEVGPPQAAAVARHFLATGEVDWRMSGLFDRE